LLVQTLAAGYAEALCQLGCHSGAVLVTVLPEQRVTFVLAVFRVGDVEYVPEERPAVPVTEQDDALGTAPDMAAHAPVP